jgi:acyl carrier protein
MGLFDKFFGSKAAANAPVQQPSANMQVDRRGEAPAVVVRKLVAQMIREDKGWQPTPAQCFPSTKFRDLGLDNLDIVDLTMRLEEVYGSINFPDWPGEHLMQMTIGEIIMVVERHCAPRAHFS